MQQLFALLAMKGIALFAAGEAADIVRQRRLHVDQMNFEIIRTGIIGALANHQFDAARGTIGTINWQEYSFS